MNCLLLGYWSAAFPQLFLNLKRPDGIRSIRKYIHDGLFMLFIEARMYSCLSSESAIDIALQIEVTKKKKKKKRDWINEQNRVIKWKSKVFKKNSQFYVYRWCPSLKYYCSMSLFQ